MRSEYGITAVEVLVVLAIVAILVAVAAPNLRDLITTNQVSHTATKLRLAMITARSEAIKRNAIIDIAPKTVGTVTGWENGWEVQVSSTSSVISNYDAVSGVTITRTDDATCSTASATPNAVVQYRNFGRVSNSNICFRITATDAPTSATKCVAVNPSGMAYYYIDSGTGQTCF
ncbi:MAG: prepilin-type N-terminal cleavage/methylation protein [Magnetococcales bacterium]|nr:prepilin-type N-terminal cleavage/methylation protein [Magnetococcales bacterium]